MDDVQDVKPLFGPIQIEQQLVLGRRIQVNIYHTMLERKRN